MPHRDDHRRSAADRQLPLRTRGDLQVVEASFDGDATYIVRDPVAAEAYHFSTEEYAMLDALRRPASLRQLQQLFETRFAPRRAAFDQLQSYVNRLYELGLLIGENPGQGEQLYARQRQQRRRARAARFLQLLSIQLGGVSASPLIDRLYRGLKWFFSPPARFLAVALVCYAAIVAVGAGDELLRLAPAAGELMTLRFLPLWILAIAGVKALHELGHALACRHFGARPQELGVLLLAGMPTLYCDVSDAWRLPSKWQRMAISSAGVAVEVLIASVAVIVWRFAEPGLLNTICLSLIIVCSAGTLLINLNPLLRYDGYYVLADWLETPNLAERARGLVSGRLRQWLLGEPSSSDPLLSPRKRRALWAYALLSRAYLILVLGVLLTSALRIARPYQMENLVYLVAVLALLGMFVGPATTIIRLAGNPSVRARLRWSRLGAACLAMGMLVVVVMALPAKRRIEAPLIVMPADAHPLFAETAGAIQYAVPAGRFVEPGDIVVRLHNPELSLSLARQEGVVRQHRLRVEQLRTLQASMPTASRLLPTALVELADAEAQLAELQKVVDSLEVRAPAAGEVLPPPTRIAAPSNDDKLPTWTGSPLEDRNVGAWIEPGTPLAVVTATERRVAWAGVSQSDIPAVQNGQRVRVVVDQAPSQFFQGEVAKVARRARSNHESPERRATQSDRIIGDGRYHVVAIDLEATPPLLPGASGRAKIVAHDSTIGELLVNQLRRTYQRVF